jgi:hypothetical protein
MFESLVNHVFKVRYEAVLMLVAYASDFVKDLCM